MGSRSHGQLMLSLAARTHGGAREGPGRRAGAWRRVAHRTRARHKRRHPVHVTLRARRLLPSFRHELVRRMFLGLLAEPSRRDAVFHVVHFSIQDDHLHLIVEVEDETTLACAMMSVAARFAKRLNKLLGRAKGRVWDHRYHRHDLMTAREVTHALRYVLANWKKHGHAPRAATKLDPFASGAAFSGWDAPCARGDPFMGVWRPPDAHTWLLAHGWIMYGPIPLGEGPVVH